jgi:hypothetical protein
MKLIPEGIVNRFANFHPTPDDRKNVVDLVAQLMKNPGLGIPIPFEKQKYKDCYLAFTADGRWRVVYRRLDQGEHVAGAESIIVVSIDREEHSL